MHQVMLADSCMDAILGVMERYAIKPALLARDAIIPGSYWGESEAGLIGDTLYLRRDTPLHSVLHEACHFVCMNAERRVRECKLRHGNAVAGDRHRPFVSFPARLR